jgi:predicted glycosyltransferase
MAGYNTYMNLLATGANAIVWPFSQNREQRMRAEKFQQKANIYILEDQEIDPIVLSKIMAKKLTAKNPVFSGINLDGATYTAHWLENAWEEK